MSCLSIPIPRRISPVSSGLGDEVTPAVRPLVWVVDDSPLDREHTSRCLASDCDTRAFADGASVLEQLATHSPPDLLVLDWVMPGVSGIEVIRFLRAASGTLPQVPVLLLTSRGQPEQIVEGLSSGANDYVAKPFHEAELRARVGALVRGARLLERAQRAEESVRILLANAPDALLALDAHGDVTYANDRAGEVFGRPPAELAGAAITTLVPDLPLSNISIGPGASLLPLPDVKVGDRVLSPSLRVLPTDTAASTTIALRDVTERRRLDARRLDFYSVMAHDLRSPLNAMSMRIELLLRGRRGVMPAEAVAELQKTQRSIRYMVKMIKDFLDLARMEAGSYRIDREQLGLVRLIGGVIEELRPLAEASGLSVTWVAPDEDVPIVGDRHRLTQVLANLLGNAIKFTPADGSVRVSVHPAAETVEVAVSDTGPGIPPDLVGTIFGRFTRGAPPSDREPRAAGWGLGLMIVREIVEAHGGTVGVQTELGRGSSFWFRLPRAAAPRIAPASA
jgi:signal transduction histidine kinase